jgi:hypothetical protein
LITIDTLRADRLGAYGYGPAETPRIDRLARQGVRFEQVTKRTRKTRARRTRSLSAREQVVRMVRERDMEIMEAVNDPHKMYAVASRVEEFAAEIARLAEGR